MALILIDNGTATGPSKIYPGGQGLFTAEGNFNGCTVSLQFQSMNGSWFDAGVDTDLTANGMGRFFLPSGAIRANVTGGTPSGLYVHVEQIST